MKTHLLLALVTASLVFAQEPSIDWDKAKQLHQRSQRGEQLTPDEQKYLDEAKRRRASGQRPAGGDAPGISADELKKLTPLTELTGEYRGRDGGLYGGGKNEPPREHQVLASRAVAEIKPLDADGKPAGGGKIVLLSIGMSNTTQEFSKFVALANAEPRKSRDVVVVDGAQGGKDATAWATADAPPWGVAEERLKANGVTAKQVGVVWIKQALIGPQAGFPAESDRLRERLAEIVKIAKSKYPNLRVAFLSSRIYAGYAKSKLNPEPYAFESAFAVRGLIEAQMKGGEKSPVLLWGPYLWAAGATPRKADGLSYAAEDFGGDGTHPADSARAKVAKLLLDFFTSDANAKPWFVGGK